jgi:metal-responsive CopG/Arc/MetJ family transcriptional regulator
MVALPLMAKDEKIAVRLDTEMLNELDKLRRDAPGLPTRAELIRRLIAKAIEEAKAKKKLKARS